MRARVTGLLVPLGLFLTGLAHCSPSYEARGASAVPGLGDAGVPQEAGVDTAPDSPTDAPADAPVGAAAGLDGATTLAEASPNGLKDPQVIPGAGDLGVGVVFVVATINAEIIRTTAVGAQSGNMIHGITHWNDFISGTGLD